MTTIASLLDTLLPPSKPTSLVSDAPAGDIQQEKVHLSRRMAELEM